MRTATAHLPRPDGSVPGIPWCPNPVAYTAQPAPWRDATSPWLDLQDAFVAWLDTI